MNWSSVLQHLEIPFFGLSLQKTASGDGGRCVYLIGSPEGTMPSGVIAQLTHFNVPVHFLSVFPAHGADSNSWKLHRGLHSENKKAKYCLSAENITVTKTNAQQPPLGFFFKGNANVFLLFVRVSPFVYQSNGLKWFNLLLQTAGWVWLHEDTSKKPFWHFSSHPLKSRKYN